MRRLGHVIDRAAGGAYARQQRRRTLDDLDPLEVGGVHRAAGHRRRADPDAVVKRVDLVAGKAAHREDRRRPRRIAAGHADRGLGDVGGGPQAAILDHLLVDHFHRRRCLPRGEAESGPDFGDDIGVERCRGRACCPSADRGTATAGARGRPAHTRGRPDALSSRVRPVAPVCVAAVRRSPARDCRVFSACGLRSAPSTGSQRAGGARHTSKPQRRDAMTRNQRLTSTTTAYCMRAHEHARHDTTIVLEIEHDTAQRRTHYPSARLPSQSALAPSGRCTSYSCDIGAPRPTRSRMTMTGSRFPGSRVIASDHLPRDIEVPSGIYGRRLSAYSCGGSRGFVLCVHAPHSLG